MAIANTPETGFDVGGRLRAWRMGQRCRACGARIVRGPFVGCQANHNLELQPADLRQPLSDGDRRAVESGYWLRWVLSATAAAVLLLAGCVLLLATTGMLALIVAGPVCVLAFLLAFLALLFGPPALAAPTREQLERQIRAAEQPAQS